MKKIKIKNGSTCQYRYIDPSWIVPDKDNPEMYRWVSRELNGHINGNPCDRIAIVEENFKVSYKDPLSFILQEGKVINKDTKWGMVSYFKLGEKSLDLGHYWADAPKTFVRTGESPDGFRADCIILKI